MVASAVGIITAVPPCAACAAQHDLVLEHQRVVRIAGRRHVARDQPLARGGIRHRVQDPVLPVQRLAREVHLRHQARQPHLAEDREMDVRRAPPAVLGRHRVGARLDGAQLERAAFVGHQARRAVEIRIGRRMVVVVGVDVAAGGIRLPDLHHRAADGRAVLVQHAHAQVHQLADRLRGAVPGDVAAEQFHAPRHLQRAGQLRERRRRAARAARADCASGVCG